MSSAIRAPKTDALKKIGCIYKDTDELLADAERLAQSIDNRAEYLLDITVEDQLLTGNGTGNNIEGLLNRSRPSDRNLRRHERRHQGH